MKRTSVVVLVLAGVVVVPGASPSFAQTEPVVTLEQALTEALARNPALAVERNAIEIAAGALRQARAYPLNPELELAGAAGRAQGIEGTLNRGIDDKRVGISQTIWLRGQRTFRLRGARANVDRAAGVVQDAERQVVGDVLRTFMDVRVAQERVVLAREIVALASDVRETADELVEAGDVPELDRFRADVELNKAQNRLIAEEQRLRTAQGELALLLGRAMDQAIRADAPLTLPPPPGDLPTVQQTALERRPDLKVAGAAVAAAEAEVALVRAEQFLPALKVGLIYDEGRSFESTDRTGRLTLSVPLPLFNRRQGDVDRALAELRQREASVELIRRRIEHEVTSAYQQVLASRQILVAFASGILPDQDRNFRLLREGYNVGEFRITDVFVGQREFIEAREAYLEAVAAFNAGTAELYRALNSRP